MLESRQTLAESLAEFEDILRSYNREQPEDQEQIWQDIMDTIPEAFVDYHSSNLATRAEQKAMLNTTVGEMQETFETMKIGSPNTESTATKEENLLSNDSLVDSSPRLEVPLNTIDDDVASAIRMNEGAGGSGQFQNASNEVEMGTDDDDDIYGPPPVLERQDLWVPEPRSRRRAKSGENSNTEVPKYLKKLRSYTRRQAIKEGRTPIQRIPKCGICGSTTEKGSLNCGAQSGAGRNRENTKDKQVCELRTQTKKTD